MLQPRPWNLYGIWAIPLHSVEDFSAVSCMSACTTGDADGFGREASYRIPYMVLDP